MSHPAVISLAERHPRGWVKPDVIAEELGINYRTVLCWIRGGQLTALGIGANGTQPYRVYLNHLDEFMTERSRRPTAPPKASSASESPQTTPRRPGARKRRSTGLIAA